MEIVDIVPSDDEYRSILELLRQLKKPNKRQKYIINELTEYLEEKELKENTDFLC